MPRRSVLTERQRSALFDLPTDQATILRHYTLTDDDIEHIRTRRHSHNRMGFALQLCAFLYPGRLLSPGETIPLEVSQFIAAQLGEQPDALACYAETDVTRRRHLADLRELYGYKMFSGRGTRDLKAWLEEQAETAPSNRDLAQKFVEECRRTQTILPGVSVVERLCADALVSAERKIESQIVGQLSDETREQLDALLIEMVDGKVSRFIWLRQFEVGSNSPDASRLLDRLEHLQGLKVPPSLLDGIPPNQITRLRRQGERYFADGLRDITSDRRLAILAVSAVEWHAAIADAVVETHDRIVGKTWRDAKKICDARIADAKSALRDTLRSFKSLGAALLEAKGDGASLDIATETACGWHQLEGLVATAAKLTDTMAADPLSHVAQGFHRFRRYAPRMLRALEVHAAPVAEPLLAAATIIENGQNSELQPVAFLRRGSKWHRHLNTCDEDKHRLWEVAVMFHLRDAFRSGDIWLAHSRRYADLKQALVPIEAAKATPRLTLPFEPGAWIADRKARLADGLARLAKAARNGSTPGGSIENGVLKIDRLSSAVPKEADELVLDLYHRLPAVRITDLLLEVDNDIGFTDALPSKRLHLFDPAAAPKELRGLVGGKIREGLIVQNWPDVLRSVATMAAGIMPPSQLLKKFASYPRQRELALALREIGRIERTLFIIEWLLDADMQRRAQIGLNKGEAHHALKNALRIGRQGEIRDRTSEGQHYRMAGLNLLAAIIIYWNTKHLGQAVTARKRAGLNCSPALLSHISPLGWAHILLTGEYRWKNQSRKPL
ncbi:MAG: Tn3 family transposase [Hyphomicrobiales bacterium]